eukprot:CAMPEP_0201113722 /NCGR_PEP_ID=MMETSP0812-20130820/78002_1 /ASSEMBLY_ACC=CAM_ASM_000668 /TAXON_ID=98059 /ORGANISM="Dinobryon sp., Strain UTEXLB2267" /LENGTH=213 /DNA_ID=CAMNT_0047377283 /DNA_START=123 /DNA_END=761 /DNA_ORIENTATION=-
MSALVSSLHRDELVGEGEGFFCLRLLPAATVELLELPLEGILALLLPHGGASRAGSKAGKGGSSLLTSPADLALAAWRGLQGWVEGREGRLQLVDQPRGDVPGQLHTLPLVALHQLRSQIAGHARVVVRVRDRLGQSGVGRPVGLQVQEEAQTAQDVAALAHEGLEAHHEQLVSSNHLQPASQVLVVVAALHGRHAVVHLQERREVDELLCQL